MDNRKIKDRLHSKVVWASILAQVLIIVMLFWPDLANYIKVIGAAVIEILTLLGILNDPTTREEF